MNNKFILKSGADYMILYNFCITARNLVNYFRKSTGGTGLCLNGIEPTLAEVDLAQAGLEPT